MNTSLRQHLIQEEAEVLHAYQDSKGYWTIGVGRLIDKRKGGGITHEEAMMLLANDIKRHTKAVLDKLPWAEFIGEARLGALISMHFQLGDNLWDFKKTLKLMEEGKWREASIELLDSKLAREDAPARAKRISEQVRSNLWQMK